MWLVKNIQVKAWKFQCEIGIKMIKYDKNMAFQISKIEKKLY
jgi:hypothetical protein